MKPKPRETDEQKKARLIGELRQYRRERESGYRVKALRLLPHICGSCGREFDGKRLRELTVHHKDHNFKNNPPDGSNWELLCLYCHDHEHESHAGDGRYTEDKPVGDIPPPVANPFANLDDLLGGAAPKDEG